MASSQCLLGILSACFTFVCVLAQQPTVTLSTGTLNGVYDTVSNGQRQFSIKKFLGIPFAEPPVGSLRLQKPQPLDRLHGNPYDASYHRPYCVQANSDPQLDQGEDEDCLYLNVYVPETAADQTSGHAVMVWVYGGGFTQGYADMYDGSMLSAVGNVIVVTINYRVGFFGFFSTGDASSAGNYGLYDQAMAFQWVHDNIASFGGDNSRVTVFGESAGSMSSSIQSMYSANFGRFQRVLAQSGVVNTLGMNVINRDVTDHVMTLKRAMKCETYTMDELVECLKTYTWKDIKAALVQLETEGQLFQSDFFLPIADGDIVLSDFTQLYDGHAALEFFRSLDFMTGHNMYDGAVMLLFLGSEIGDVNNWTPSQDDMMIDVFGQLGVSGFPVSSSVRQAIIHEYTNWTNPHAYESVRVQYMKLLTDVYYTAPTAQMLQWHAVASGTGNTYAYLFSPVTSSRMPWTPSWLPGADHAEELRSVFGMYFELMPEWEKEMSARMMTYWSNFAKTG